MIIISFLTLFGGKLGYNVTSMIKKYKLTIFKLLFLKRKVIFIALAILFLLTILGLVSASKAAGSYQKDISIWKKEILNPLAASLTGSRFTDIMVIERPENATELKAQYSKCDSIKVSFELANAASSVPELSPNPFGLLVPGYKSAQKTKSSIGSTQATIIKDVTFLQNYCSLYTKAVSKEITSNEATSKLDSFYLIKGESNTILENGNLVDSVCQSDTGCLADDPKKLKPFLEQYKLITDTYYRDPSWKYDTLCTFEEFGSICKSYKEHQQQQAKLRDDYHKVVSQAQSVSANKDIDKASEAIAQSQKFFINQVRADFKKQFPGTDINKTGYITKQQIILLKVMEDRLATETNKLKSI